MRFGVCRPITDLASAAALGFDYLEAPATELAAMPEEDFQRVKRQALTVPVRVEALNVLFPGDLRLLAPASEERMLAHASLVFQRGKELGVQTVVFGSGAARSFSEELSFEQAVRVLTGKIRRLGELAAKYGIFIAVEPLRRAESNLINTVAEGAMLAAAVDHPHVRVLADSYHMFSDREPAENITRTGQLWHTHVALTQGRAYPVTATGELQAFFAALRTIGYNGRMSIEGNTDCFAQDAPLALETLRKLACAQ